MKMLGYTKQQIDYAIERDAVAWAKMFGVNDEAEIEARKQVKRANINAGYIGSDLQEHLPPVECL
jgi:hypothetical protein